MAFEDVSKILEKELGADTLTTLSSLTETPIASASIGQVHKAQYDGQEIALKIQFPGVDKSLESDVYLLKKIANAFVKIQGKDIQLDDLFEEFIDILKQEVDYLKEASHMTRYREMLASDPRYVIPIAIPNLTTSRVLGMTYESGMRPQDWLDSSPSDEERDFFARAFLDLYVSEFYRHGFVQTDANFGNFLIRPREKQLVLLDFGAMKVFDEDFRNQYRTLLKLIQTGNDEEIFQFAVEIGMLDSRESKECQKAFGDMLRLSVAPFEGEGTAFDFGSSEYSTQMNEKSMKFTRLIRYSPPPKNILFLHRKLSGLFRLLQSMKVKITLQEYWENFVSV